MSIRKVVGKKKKKKDKAFQSIPVNNSCEGKKLNWRLKWGRLKVTEVIQVGGNVDWSSGMEYRKQWGDSIYRTLVPQLGIKPMPPSVEAPCLTY